MNDASLPFAHDLHQQGISAFERGELPHAIDLLEQALAQEPANPHIRVNLGIALNHAQRHAAALIQLDLALAISSDLPMAYFQKALAFEALKRFPEALQCVEHVLITHPDDPLALTLRAQLHVRSAPELALADFARAVELAPSALTWFNLGCAHHRLGHDESALAAFDQALQHDPEFMQAWCNKGNTLRDLGQPVPALACYEQAQKIAPTHPSVLWNLSLSLLQLGDYANGWPLYEYRWPTSETPMPDWPGQRLRQTQDLTGQRILIAGEQGLGDMIQFLRYVPLLAQQGAQLIVQLPVTLHSLVQTLPGVVQCIDMDEPFPACDAHCPIMSLPLLFQTQVQHIASHDQAYLHADPATVELWRQRLGPSHSLRIGLVVRGQTRNPREHVRSVGLATLLPYLPVQHEYVLLHPSIHPDDQSVLACAPHVRDVSQDIQTMADTAALCTLMDVVISVDTSVAHLSAALGRPTWIMLALASDWRWLLNRPDSPWYDSVQLFRQQQAHDWTEVLEDVAQQLEMLGR